MLNASFAVSQDEGSLSNLFLIRLEYEVRMAVDGTAGK